MIVPEIAHLIVAFVHVARFRRRVGADRMNLARGNTVDGRNAVRRCAVTAMHTVVVPAIMGGDVRDIYSKFGY